MHSDPRIPDRSTDLPRRRRTLRGGAARRAASAVARVPGAGRDRAAEIAELRRIFPDLPRRPQRRDLEGRAERLLRRAAANEAAREGADLVERLVDLPEGWGRADLTAAEISGLPSYEAFVVAAANAPCIRPVAHGAADALAMARSDAANDELGITLEGAGDAVSFLLTRTWELLGAEGAQADDRNAYLDGWRDRARAIVRDALTRAVTVPQELRVAMRRRDELRAAMGRRDEQRAEEAVGHEDPTGPQQGHPGQSEPREEHQAGAEHRVREHRLDQGAFGAAGSSDGAKGAGSGDDGAKGPGAARFPSSASGSTRSFGQRIKEAQDFLQSDLGRGARDFLASPAGKAAMQFVRDHGKEAGIAARDLYTAAREQRSGKGSGSGTTRPGP